MMYIHINVRKDAIHCNLDGTREYHAKQNKSEREGQIKHMFSHL